MVRRRLSASEIAASAGTLDASRTLTDRVGVVEDVDELGMIVATRHGRERVAWGDVVTWKILGPKPVRRGAPHRAVSVLDLEELMVDGWRPCEQAWLGRWMLRSSGGFTGRASSALVLGESGRPLAEALAEVQRWYAERGLPALLQVPMAPGFDADEDAVVREAVAMGWGWFRPVRVMTAASAVVARSASTVANDVAPPVESTSELTDTWRALAHDKVRSFEAAARQVLTASPDQRFLTATQGGESVAHARLALSPGWGGIFVVATREDARRQNHEHSLVAACAREAAAAGASSLYLQVAADDDGAIALYESLGFTTHHTYVYLRPTTAA